MGTLNLGLSKEAVAKLNESSASFDPVPEGSYNVTIFEIKTEEIPEGKRNAGGMFFNIQYRISDGSQENRRLFDRVYLFSEWEAGTFDGVKKEASANFSLKQFFGAVGVDVSQDDWHESVPDADALRGQPLVIKVKHRKYKDDIRESVAGYKPFANPVTSKATVVPKVSAGGATPNLATNTWACV